jgi:hypothetical protein
MAVAQQMLRLQQQVPLLMLMEWAFPAQPYPGQVALIWGEQSELNPFASKDAASAVWGPLCFQHTTDWVPGGHGGFFAPDAVGHLAQALARRLDVHP